MAELHTQVVPRRVRFDPTRPRGADAYGHAFRHSRRVTFLNPTAPKVAACLPERAMPGSKNKEAAEGADKKATSPVKTPKMPKSILKEPKIGVLHDESQPSTSETPDEAPSSVQETATSTNISRPELTSPA